MDHTAQTPSRDRSAGSALERLAEIMARLRDPDGGCPWDLKQDFTSIAPYTIEEAYEVADAIERGDFEALRGELGDLQLQVVYHARMAEESGFFGLADVIEDISNKMVRRHPHVFGSEDGVDDGRSPGWEALKAEERAQDGQAGALDGVARALPALLRAQKLQKRAARNGFDWPDASGPRAKIDEEIDELENAKDEAEVTEEIGDLLFAVVNLARHLKVDAEAALRQANAKFETRFSAMEKAGGAQFSVLSLEEMEELWQAAKR